MANTKKENVKVAISELIANGELELVFAHLTSQIPQERLSL